MSTEPIKMWRFDEAPEEYRQFATPDGREKWLAHLPATWNGEAPEWLGDGSVFGGLTVSCGPLPDGAWLFVYSQPPWSHDPDEMIVELEPGAEQAVRTKNAIALECLQHLFHAIPFGHEFTLSNSMGGRIGKYVEPREKDGTPEAGIDVQLFINDQRIGEVEFFIRNTGWGMLVEPKPVKS